MHSHAPVSVLQYEFTSSAVHFSSPLHCLSVGLLVGLSVGSLVGFSVGLMVVSVEFLFGLLVGMSVGWSVVVLSVGLLVVLSK